MTQNISIQRNVVRLQERRQFVKAKIQNKWKHGANEKSFWTEPRKWNTETGEQPHFWSKGNVLGARRRAEWVRGGPVLTWWLNERENSNVIKTTTSRTWTFCAIEDASGYRMSRVKDGVRPGNTGILKQNLFDSKQVIWLHCLSAWRQTALEQTGVTLTCLTLSGDTLTAPCFPHSSIICGHFQEWFEEFTVSPVVAPLMPGTQWHS